MAEPFEFDAVAADDALLDLLGGGGDLTCEAMDAADDDAAVQLLGELRLAVEEDDYETAVVRDAEEILAACTALQAEARARKLAARTLALGGIAVAALSVSGVAAAVTGDPLSPYEKVIQTVVDGLDPRLTFPIDRLNGLVVGTKQSAQEAHARVQQRARFQHDKDEAVTEPSILLTGDDHRAAVLLPSKPMARAVPPVPLTNNPSASVTLVPSPPMSDSSTQETENPQPSATTAPSAPETTDSAAPQSTETATSTPTPAASESVSAPADPSPAPSSSTTEPAAPSDTNTAVDSDKPSGGTSTGTGPGTDSAQQGDGGAQPGSTTPPEPEPSKIIPSVPTDPAPNAPGGTSSGENPGNGQGHESPGAPGGLPATPASSLLSSLVAVVNEVLGA